MILPFTVEKETKAQLEKHWPQLVKQEADDPWQLAYTPPLPVSMKAGLRASQSEVTVFAYARSVKRGSDSETLAAPWGALTISIADPKSMLFQSLSQELKKIGRERVVDIPQVDPPPYYFEMLWRRAEIDSQVAYEKRPNFETQLPLCEWAQKYKTISQALAKIGPPLAVWFDCSKIMSLSPDEVLKQNALKKVRPNGRVFVSKASPFVTFRYFTFEGWDTKIEGNTIFFTPTPSTTIKLAKPLVVQIEKSSGQTDSKKSSKRNSYGLVYLESTSKNEGNIFEFTETASPFRVTISKFEDYGYSTELQINTVISTLQELANKSFGESQARELLTHYITEKKTGLDTNLTKISVEEKETHWIIRAGRHDFKVEKANFKLVPVP
jgi:hypothetical protein